MIIKVIFLAKIFSKILNLNKKLIELAHIYSEFYIYNPFLKNIL